MKRAHAAIIGVVRFVHENGAVKYHRVGGRSPTLPV